MTSHPDQVLPVYYEDMKKVRCTIHISIATKTEPSCYSQIVHVIIYVITIVHTTRKYLLEFCD